MKAIDILDPVLEVLKEERYMDALDKRRPRPFKDLLNSPTCYPFNDHSCFLIVPTNYIGKVRAISLSLHDTGYHHYPHIVTQCGIHNYICSKTSYMLRKFIRYYRR